MDSIDPKSLSASYKILRRATEKVWHRAEEIVKQNKVKVIEMTEKTFSAIVKGTEDYTVKLVIKRINVDTSCNCPFRGYGVCKHVVAAALVWDRDGIGVKSPDQREIKSQCMPEPDNSGRNKIKEMYADPLKANLNDLRHFYKLGSNWSRPHAKLPDMPPIEKNPNKPLTIKEVKKALKQIVKWSNRSTYDYYFCAGEMIAAFCEVIKVIKSRIPATDMSLNIDILLFAQQFHNRELLQVIDDSDGMRILSEVYLDDLCNEILKKLPVEYKAKIEEYNRNKECYE